MPDKPKIILITGASSGIGKACAEYLSEQGHTVYGTSRYPGSYPKPNGYNLIQMDVNDTSSIHNGIEHIINESGKIDVVVNNAGYGLAGAISDTSIAKAQEQFDTLFWGAMRVIHYALPIMQKQNSGLIINVSSIGGLMGLPYQGYYSAAKFAIEGFTEALYKELRSTKVRAVLVEPGDFKTEFTSKRDISRKSKSSKDFQRTLAVIENDEQSGQDPIKIAYLINKIINKENPQLRYVVGAFDQKLAALLKRILPQRFFDWILMKHYNVV